LILYRVPEQQGPKSVVIDRNTYGRLLKACNYKTKEELEEERMRENEEQDKLVVIIIFNQYQTKILLFFLFIIERYI
jgi:hypothetical protein